MDYNSTIHKSRIIPIIYVDAPIKHFADFFLDVHLKKVTTLCVLRLSSEHFEMNYRYYLRIRTLILLVQLTKLFPFYQIHIRVDQVQAT